MSRNSKQHGLALLTAVLLAIISLGGSTGCKPNPRSNSGSGFCNPYDFGASVSSYYVDFCPDPYH